MSSLLPTRDFVLVVDPSSAEGLAAAPLYQTVVLISDLATLAPPITIKLVFPEYLASAEQVASVEIGLLPVSIVGSEKGIPTVPLVGDLRRRVRDRILRGAEGDCRGLRLLSLAEHLKADGIVTEISSLVEPRGELLRHQRFRIILPSELSDFVEVVGRGHDAPCAVWPSATTQIPYGVLYQFTHWKGRLLFNWFNKASPALAKDGPLQELVRSALLNRYAFILRARDSVLFYRLQADHQKRHGETRPVFREQLNYHLTTFYTHVWGMLDTLTQIANRQLGLGIDPFRCHINRDDFLLALDGKRPALRRFIAAHGGQWVPIIGDVRHPVAHAALRLQTDLLAETLDSKKSDAEIVQILRAEDPETYRIIPPELLKEYEPVMISNWRIDKMKVVSDDMINVEKPEGGYLRQPVASIDFDLERLNAFIDAFLIACFGK